MAKNCGIVGVGLAHRRRPGLSRERLWVARPPAPCDRGEAGRQRQADRVRDTATERGARGRGSEGGRVEDAEGKEGEEVEEGDGRR